VLSLVESITPIWPSTLLRLKTSPRKSENYNKRI
ncbi:unnamed protein product, partial [marine sediment metagenome]